MAKERWIQTAIRHPGRLRAYVRRVYGEEGFSRSGTIRVEILRDLARRKDAIGRAAKLALRLRKMKEE